MRPQLNPWKSYFENTVPPNPRNRRPLKSISIRTVRAEARLWKPRVNSELNAKIEMILLLVLGALGLGAIGYGIEGLASFVNNNAMDHVVTALLR
jgi:hypothetical protein